MRQLPSIVLFIPGIYFLCYVSRKTIDELYLFLKLVLRHNRLVYLIIAVIFFPGTVLHELSHAVMARLLLLKVTEIKLTPEFKGNTIQLGRVTYIGAGFIRRIIVGVAPVIGGIILLWWIAGFKIHALLIYCIFVISSTMFSSKQDLVDAVYLLPGIAVVVFLMIFLKINIVSSIFTIKETLFGGLLDEQIMSMNIIIGVALLIHISLIILLKILRNVIRYFI